MEPDPEARRPQPAHAPRLGAELEGHAAQDEPAQHDDDGQVEGPEQHRVGGREDAEQRRPRDDQPCLVAVPHGRHRVHHGAAVPLGWGEEEQHADAEVEAVEHDVEQEREAEGGGPERHHGVGLTRPGSGAGRPARAPCAPRRAAVGLPPGMESGRLALVVVSSAGRSIASGPRRSVR